MRTLLALIEAPVSGLHMMTASNGERRGDRDRSSSVNKSQYVSIVQPPARI